MHGRNQVHGQHLLCWGVGSSLFSFVVLLDKWVWMLVGLHAHSMPLVRGDFFMYFDDPVVPVSWIWPELLADADRIPVHDSMHKGLVSSMFPRMCADVSWNMPRNVQQHHEPGNLRIVLPVQLLHRKQPLR